MSPLPKKCPVKFVSGHLSCHADLVTPNAYPLPKKCPVKFVSGHLSCHADLVTPNAYGTSLEVILEVDAERFRITTHWSRMRGSLLIATHEELLSCKTEIEQLELRLEELEA